MERQGDWNICVLCKIKLKYTKNTSSMINHLQLRHQPQYWKWCAPGHTKAEASLTIKPSTIQPSLVQTFERRAKYQPGSSRKDLLDGVCYFWSSKTSILFRLLKIKVSVNFLLTWIQSISYQVDGTPHALCYQNYLKRLNQGYFKSCRVRVPLLWQLTSGALAICGLLWLLQPISSIKIGSWSHVCSRRQDLQCLTPRRTLPMSRYTSCLSGTYRLKLLQSS